MPIPFFIATRSIRKDQMPSSRLHSGGCQVVRVVSGEMIRKNLKTTLSRSPISTDSYSREPFHGEVQITRSLPAGFHQMIRILDRQTLSSNDGVTDAGKPQSDPVHGSKVSYGREPFLEEGAFFRLV